ncbi:DUF1127 domain-containing protein [Salmonella enterica]|nr:DUF1127 domain-containing protein [Salmonella enterica]EEA5169007.1 DUF1127 domain-containing protein [Salmonella enterica]EFR5475589.1 DUF1127 domain-containing protein [Salmonella enterica]EIZ8056331.1 DUF1127 domain-containing protein [Salmonella enterica]EKZ7846678.1 DUF1127 domain-containing protein [Salmonella enterica]
MEFYENRARQPFIGFAQLWRGLRRWWLRRWWLRRWWLRRIARQALRRMSDQQLRDIGLDRKGVK